MCAERGTLPFNALSGAPVHESVTLPFGMPWFGATRRTLWLTPYGSGYLQDASPAGLGPTIGPAVGPGGSTAYFSMYPGRVSSTEWSPTLVCARTFGAAPARRFAAEWRGTFLSPSSRRVEPLDLIAILHEQGAVEFRYVRVPAPPAQALGIKGGSPVATYVALFPFDPPGPTTVTFTPR